LRIRYRIHMNPPTTCPECGAPWQDSRTCQDDFHQMLYWENEVPENGEVHHLMVLCYHLQHPSLYSPEGLEYAKDLLDDFIAKGLSPQEVRRGWADQVSSRNRRFHITARPGAQGSYPVLVQWPITARDVVNGRIDQYRENTRTWANSVYEALKAQSRQS